MRIEVCSDLPLASRALRGLLGSLGIAALLAARFVPFHLIPPICSFRRITGHPCVGCGMTRSWVHFAHGRVTEAFVQSPLGAVLFVALLASLAYLALRSFAGLPALRLRTEPLWLWVLGALGTAGVAAHWIYLEVSGVAL